MKSKTFKGSKRWLKLVLAVGVLILVIILGETRII